MDTGTYREGYRDTHFGERTATYFNLIYYKYHQPVTSIAIFTESNKLFHPKSHEYDFLGTAYIYRFNTYKIIAQDERELAANPNPFAIIVLTVLLALKKNKLPDIEAITKNKKTMGIEELILDRVEKKSIEKGRVKGIKEGIEKGKEQGREEGAEQKSQEVVKNLLAANKFTISEIANFANVTEAFVKKVRSSLKK